ncbi:MAG: hypothetical protein KDB07_05790 [Planctomycetes bacterium]|nr:hypothetical protein [Planctomycetota bacterium]
MKTIIMILVSLAALGLAFAAHDSRAQDSQQEPARTGLKAESHKAGPLFEADDPDIEATEIKAEVFHFSERRKDFQSRTAHAEIRYDDPVSGQIMYRASTESDFGVVVDWAIDLRSYARTGTEKLPIHQFENPGINPDSTGLSWSPVFDLEEASKKRTFYPYAVYVGGERDAKELSANVWVHVHVAKTLTYGKIKNVAALSVGDTAFESEDEKFKVKVHAKGERSLTLHFLGEIASLRILEFEQESFGWTGQVVSDRSIDEGREVEFKMAEKLPDEYFLPFAMLGEVRLETLLIKTEKFQLP